MDSNSLNATEIAVGSLLAGGAGRGGYGGGGAWDGGYGGVQYAGMNTIQHGLECNRDIAQTGIENLQREFANIGTRDLITEGQNRICDKLSSSETRNSDQLFALARDIDNKFSAVTEQNHQAALATKDAEIRAVERFCKLESGHATIIAKMDANKEFGELFAENQALKTQVACGCVTGCSTPCGGHHGRG